jgi:hypothetical protein
MARIVIVSPDPRRPAEFQALARARELGLLEGRNPAAPITTPHATFGAGLPPGAVLDSPP